tara:strand:+ start:15932 stop:16360 length:429 start_codon:yes stop_codon:yes gene_type:complete
MRKPDYKRAYRECEDGDERAELASAEWESIKAHLAERDLLTDRRMKIADRLAREVVEYEFLFPTVAAEGAVLVGGGENAGEYFNYRFSALKKHQAEILKLEEALQITVKGGDGKGKEPERPKVAADRYLSGGPDQRIRAPRH